ncbi:MAG: 3'(2'),5'-bisphosphate nucleotidase CysQ [Proteobacteria bacterium]|nr:3'(2'),5'-bisphosphate nucleotidase CysQ [Pseudomonadota bacterium]
MDRELDVALAAANQAAAAVKAIYDTQDFTVQQKSGDRGPLTEADLRANQILIDVISAAFPDDAILSEETKDTDARLSNRRVWIIDPVDGTREFTLGIPEFCVSVGFVLDGQAVVGVLANPATGQVVAGAVGKGVTLNGEPVQTSDVSDFGAARLLVSRSEFEKGWFDELKDEATFTPMGSVAWKFALVAAGLAEASFTPKPRNEWDLCGGVACILAGGGEATDGSGTRYTFNRPDPLHIGVCGTNGALHSRILELIQR